MDSKQLEKRKKVLLDLMNDKIYVPMKIKELAIILQVSKEERPDLELVLNELLAEGKIEISKRGKYKIAKEKTVTGTFVTHPKGFGFIEVEGRDDDIYVSEENIGNAFYGDVVQATLISGTTGKRQEGRITQVISHTVTEVVGIYEQSKHFGFVIPDNQKILQDIFIPQECAKGAVNGHKVIAEITSYGSNKKKPEGRITKIIGHISDPGTDVLSIVYAKDLPFEFPEKVLNQAERVKDEVSEADMQGRLDLRKVPTLTRKTVSAILQGIRADKLYMFKNNPEEFITKVIRLINEQKATMIVEHISYDTIEGEYDSTIFTAEKNTQSFDKAFLAKKAIQDYVFTDGSAEQSIERRFAEDLDAAEEVCVYAKLPRTFQIPTPVGNYSPDWAIAFYEGTVKHIFFVAETKGTMETLNLRPIEQAKISCAKKLFNEMSNSKVVYHDVDSYQSLLNIMNSI